MSSNTSNKELKVVAFIEAEVIPPQFTSFRMVNIGMLYRLNRDVGTI